MLSWLPHGQPVSNGRQRRDARPTVSPATFEELTLEHLREVPPDALPGLLAHLASEQARLVARLAKPAQPTTPPAGDTLTLQEFAALVQKSTRWVRRAVRSGHISFAHRVGRSLIFPRAAAADYLARQCACYASAPNPRTEAK